MQLLQGCQVPTSRLWVVNPSPLLPFPSVPSLPCSPLFAVEVGPFKFSSRFGALCRKEFSTNSASQCTAACTDNHRGTSQISAHRCPTSQQGSIFDPLLGVSWWFRDAGSTHSVHGPSLWPARRFETLYRTAWEIRILAGTAFRRLLKTHLFSLYWSI